MYQTLIEALPPIEGSQRAALVARGLTEDAIARHGLRHFGRMGSRGRCVELCAASCDLNGVPGFWHDESSQRLAGWSGVSIPVIAHDGMIVGIVIRPDKPIRGKKYVWLSSNNKPGGTKADAAANVPRISASTDTSTIRVTEGALKAIDSYELSGVPTVGMSSCSTWMQALPALEHFRPKRVLIALDADHTTNPQVARGLVECFVGLSEHGGRHGYEVSIERWDLTDQTKGIDDLLKAGGTPELLSGAAAVAYVEGLRLRHNLPARAKPMDESSPCQDGDSSPKSDLVDRVKTAIGEGRGMEGLYGNHALMTELASCDQVTLARVRNLIQKQRASLKDFDKAVASFTRPVSAPEVELPPYAVDGGRICQVIRDDRGVVYRPLANYSGRIVEEIILDDGVGEPRRTLVMEGAFDDGRPLPRKEVPAETFDKMEWAGAAWSAGASIEPGAKEYLRAAINYLSGVVPTRAVYGHIGWRLVDGKWLFLHVGGAIGANGPVDGVCVQVPNGLKEYILPDPPDGDRLIANVQASLALLELGPDQIMIPLLAAVYRAPLGRPEYSAHLEGPTGSFKSSVAGLAVQHYGAGWSYKHFPASWEASASALESLGACAADALFVIDEYHPAGSRSNVDQLGSKVDRILRGAANGSSRQRLDWKSKSVHEGYTVRGQILSTGEDTPRGESLRARIMTLQVEPGSIGPMDALVAASELGRQGVFSSAMAGYIRWLAGRKDTGVGGSRSVRQTTPTLDDACSGGHARLAGGVGGLFAGWRSLLEFAAEIGAISDGQSEDLYTRGMQAFVSNAGEQTAEAADEEESARFLRLIYAAIDSGRAHLASRKGSTPPQPERYGWRNIPNSSTTYEPLGACVGWVDGSEVFLDPETAYAAANAVASAQQMPMTITPRTLWKRLAQHGLIKTRDTARERYTIRKTLGGVRREVLHIVWRDGGEEEADSADYDGVA